MHDLWESLERELKVWVGVIAVFGGQELNCDSGSFFLRFSEGVWARIDLTVETKLHQRMCSWIPIQTLILSL